MRLLKDTISVPGVNVRLAFIKTAGPAMAVGLGVFGLGVATATLTRHWEVSGWTTLADEAVLGLAAGLVVFFYEKQRQQALVQRLKLVNEMTSHIRNAAHIIAYFVAHCDGDHLDTNIANSIKRIHWALREVDPDHPENWAEEAGQAGMQIAPPPSAAPQQNSPLQ